MLYQSQAKIRDIISGSEKKVWDRLSIGEVKIKDTVSIEVEAKDDLQKALSILKHQEKYKEEINDSVSEGDYCFFCGYMSYTEFESGNYRKNAKSKLLMRISEYDFFEDDYLLFKVKLDLYISQWEYLIVKCKAGNIGYFSSLEFHKNIIFCANTADPGILRQKIPVKGVVRIDTIDKKQKTCYGNPLYIKTNYE